MDPMITENADSNVYHEANINKEKENLNELRLLLLQ
jgi:hypothetical protein